MGIWAEIAKALNSTIKNPAKFKPLDVLMGEQADALDSKLSGFQSSAENGGIPVVRHIQRGEFSFGKMSTSTSVTLSGFTDLNKMEVILNGFRTPSSTTYTQYIAAPYPMELTLTKLTIECQGSSTSSSASGSASAYGYYQVIEYY